MTPDREPQLDDDRCHARISGVLFIVTFITSIGALALFQPVLDDPAGYLASGGKDSQIYLGVFLELLLIISPILSQAHRDGEETRVAGVDRQPVAC